MTNKNSNKCRPGALASIAVIVGAPILAASLLLIGLVMWGFDLSDREYGKHYRGE